MQPDRTRPTLSNGWPPQPLAQCAGLCSVCSMYSNWKNQLLKIDSSMLEIMIISNFGSSNK